MDAARLHSDYIAGKRIDEAYGKYRLSCKAGSYCEFGYDQVSNQRHQHSCYELCLVISGRGSFLYGNEAFSIKEGDVIMADPGMPHEIRANARESLLLLYIFIEMECSGRPTVARSLEDKCIEGFLKSHFQKSSQRHLLAYVNFIEEYNSPKRKLQFGTCQALKNLILESLISLSCSGGVTNEQDVKNIIENSLDYIDANLHKKVVVSDVAESSHTTVRNLEYLFQRHLNRTVVGYINEKKVDLACHYLSMFFSITDTAAMVGISNPSHFSTLFRRYKKLSPKAYQQACNIDKKGMGRRI